MRVLTTAIDKGEVKVPEAKHKATLYALAPGEALRLTEPSEVVKITPEMAKRAEYAWLLCWREGRTLAEFALDDVIVAQPIKPDPVHKRRKHDEESEDSAPAGVSERRSSGGGGATAQEPTGTALGDRGTPRKRGKGRRPPPDLL